MEAETIQRDIQDKETFGRPSVQDTAATRHRRNQLSRGTLTADRPVALGLWHKETALLVRSNEIGRNTAGAVDEKRAAPSVMTF